MAARPLWAYYNLHVVLSREVYPMDRNPVLVEEKARGGAENPHTSFTRQH